METADVKAAVSIRVGPYGPFKFDSRFAFSDFSNFGRGKNSGLMPCVDAATGKKCVLDIGAHIGLVTLPLSEVLDSDGRVFSFEPGDDNRKFLRKHLDLNAITNVEVRGLVVGDRNLNEVEFFEQEGDSPMNSLAIRGEGGVYFPVVKRQTDLDSFCRNEGLSPDVIKIDVEGAEIKVLRGAREVLIKHKPLVFLSVHRDEIRELGGSLDELMALIVDVGYEVFDLNKNVIHKIDTNEYLLKPVVEI